MYTVKDDMILFGVDNVKLFYKLSPDVSFEVYIFTVNCSPWMEKGLRSWITTSKPNQPYSDQ